MAFSRGYKNQILKNRKKFLKKLGINLEDVAEVKQVHGNRVVLVNKINSSISVADGLITDKPKIYLLMKIADCIPIGLYDPIHQAIGLIHVGYKGLAKKIIKKVIKDMQKNFKTNPLDLKVEFGPSIGPCHYRMDLWTEAEKQLIQCGILKKNIYNPRICTYESKDYFSHRRAVDQNTADFRFATILGLHVN